MDERSVLDRVVAGTAAHVRRVSKPDGRSLLLYGRKAHVGTMALENLDGGPKDAQLRWHPLRQEWSVYAAGRQGRTFKPSLADDPLAPMRAGDSAATVTEIPFTDFELAIFENRFPSFSPQTGDQRSSMAVPPGVNIQQASGRCEVVVYTSEATGNLGTLSEDQRLLLVQAWIDRYEVLHHEGAKFVLPFENRGEEVGVTLLHPHGQIYAFPVVPRVQRDAAAAFSGGYDLAKDIAQWSDYCIAERENIVAFAPPFAKFPYEIWIAPRYRHAHLCDHSDHELQGYAQLLGEVTRRYDRYFGRDTPFMMSLHASPLGSEDSWHFTTQFYPILRSPDKIKYLATVEQATGLFTVDVLPEDTARIFKAL